MTPQARIGIDEARTPLIISGRVADAAKLYYRFASIVRSLQRDADYEVEEDKRVVQDAAGPQLLHRRRGRLDPHRFLGLNVGPIIPGHKASPPEKRQQYGFDITYGTNNEMGFDYLRDNMAGKLADRR